MTINLDFYATLATMALVLIVGRFTINRIKFLKDYNIPEPVVGGILGAVILFLALKLFNLTVKFDTSMRNTLMLAFFATIGLSADFSSLKKGGKLLIKFLLAVTGLLFIQNIVGIAISMGMGQNPLIGMLAGSISMSGGHGTGATWATIFSGAPYHLEGAMEVALAMATFGLILGGIIGGPVARYLITKHNLKSSEDETTQTEFEKPQNARLITSRSLIETIALIAICLLIGSFLYKTVSSINQDLKLPEFVWCLFVGVVLRNVLTGLKLHNVFDREVSVIGNVSLSLFLAIALITINISQLLSLALPITVILLAQGVIMVLYAVFITFRVSGKDYDAAVLSAGHCGFGLGATPTAIVNMQAITNKYGPSHAAFIVVPMVGAFFIDILNALIISGFLKLPIFG